MKSVFIISMLVVLFLPLGCTEQRLKSISKSEDVWDENFKEELKGMTETGQTYQGHTDDRNSDEGLMFFNRHKPQIKTAQLWLESGKVITTKIKDYLSSFMPDTDDTELPAREKIIGRWYGLDRGHEEAIVFIFETNGHFLWQAQGETKSGTYQVDHSEAPYRIILLAADNPTQYTTSFEFINNNALLFKGKDRDIILFKNSEKS